MLNFFNCTKYHKNYISAYTIVDPLLTFKSQLLRFIEYSPIVLQIDIGTLSLTRDSLCLPMLQVAVPISS